MSDCGNQYCAGWNCPSSSYQKAAEEVSKSIRQRIFAQINNKKEDTTMQVTYNGFTGELVKLERTFTTYPHIPKYATYDLVISILKEGVCARVSFTGVKMEDVRFSGVAVSFGE